MKIEFFHQCNPPTATAQQRRHTSRGSYHNPATKKAAATWQAILEQHKPTTPIPEPVSVTIYITFPLTVKQGKITHCWKTTKPDCDNLAKLILDAATKLGYWKDDAHVAQLTVAKYNGEITGIFFKAENMKG